ATVRDSTHRRPPCPTPTPRLSSARVRVDRYIFSELVRPSLLGLAFYTFVLMMNQLFLVIRQALQQDAPILLVLQLLALALPKILVMTLPMALLLGTLVGMGRLSSDSEITALRAAGVSYFRMARPVLAVGLIGTLASLLLYNLAVPGTNRRIEALRVALLKKA